MFLEFIVRERRERQTDIERDKNRKCGTSNNYTWYPSQQAKTEAPWSAHCDPDLMKVEEKPDLKKSTSIRGLEVSNL